MLASVVIVFVLAISGVKSRHLNDLHLDNSLGDTPLYKSGKYGGDISGISSANERNSIVDLSLLWPNATVPYVIGSTAVNLEPYILAGMEDYHAHTCVRFVPWKEGMGDDYVRIEWYEGCWSALGREGGEQFLSLGTGCHWKGLVVHELGHAIGFNHEQSRSDRDDYIEILWENIEDKMVEWFEKVQPWEHNLLGEHFDYKSIMLYEEDAFSKNELPTVRVKQPGVEIGPVWKKPGLSESDIRRVNRLYQCFNEVRPDPLPVPDLECDFEGDDCGIKNQENMGSYFERKLSTLGGRTGRFLELEKGPGNVGARLITPYWQTYGRESTCLSFDYYSDGEAITEINVTQQGRETIQVASLNTTTGNHWIRETIELTMPGKSRFFLEVIFDSRLPHGRIAFDNLIYSVEKCK